MAQDIANEKQNLSYTNLDFSSIYVEVLDMIKNLTKDWDPSISNESDPGVVLVKLSALLADKCNYNIDKSILEAFPLSVTQDSNARQLYEQLGYYMGWYNAATTEVSLSYKVTSPDDDGNPYQCQIPKFTTVTNDNETVVYTLVGVEGESGVVVSDGTLFTDSAQQLKMVAYEGIPTSYTFNGKTTITPSMVDENNRLYFATSYVFENGIFINNVEQDNYSEWHRVDNLYEYSYNVNRYKFGYDSSSNLCYIEFPDNYAELFGSGIEIVYLTFSTDEPYSDVPAQYLTKLLTELTVQSTSGTEITLGASSLNVSNTFKASGHKDKESINDAYRNYKKTVATFNTLTTLRDYANYIKSEKLDICSNALVTDRTNDPQATYQIISNTNGVESLVTEVARDSNSIKYVKTSDEDIMPNKTYYSKDGTTFTQVSNPTISGLSNYYEDVSDDVLSPFSLKCYLLNKSVALTSRLDYDNTFSVVTDKINMNDLLEDSSHLVHNFEDVEPLNKNLDFAYAYKKITRPSEKTSSGLDKDIYSIPGEGTYYKKTDNNGVISFEVATVAALTDTVYNNHNLTASDFKSQYNNNIYYKANNGTYETIDRRKDKSSLSPGVYYSSLKNGVGENKFAIGTCLTDDSVEYFEKVDTNNITTNDLLSKIIFLKSKYPLDLSIATYASLGYDAKNDVISSIITALYKNLDSSSVEFGTPVSQDYLKTIIIESDSRIKDVTFDNTLSAEMFAVYYDEDTDTFNEIKLPSTYTDISQGVEMCSTGKYITSQLDEIISNKIGKEIICKSILKGVSQLLLPASSFNYHLNNKFVEEISGIKYITGEAVINLNNYGQYYTLSGDSSSSQKVTKSYTLKENETITLFKPAFKSIQDFTSGVHYDYICYQGLSANQTYQLGSGEKFVFYVANQDNNGNTISYTVYVFQEGCIISSTESIEPRKTMTEGIVRSKISDSNVNLTCYTYTEDSTDRCSLINNSTSISNTKVGTNATISIKEVDTFTVKDSDGYRFLWILNKPVDNKGNLSQYMLFDKFDPDSITDIENEESINTYTLKSGELLYYADDSLSTIGILGAGTTISRSCGVNNSSYKETQNNNEFGRTNTSGFIFASVEDLKSKSLGNGIIGISDESYNPHSLGLYEYDSNTELYSRTKDTKNEAGKNYFILLMKNTSGWAIQTDTKDNDGNIVNHFAKAPKITSDVFTVVDYVNDKYIFTPTDTYVEDSDEDTIVYQDVSPSELGLYEQVTTGDTSSVIYDSYRLADKNCVTSDNYTENEMYDKDLSSKHIRYTDTEDTTMFDSKFLFDSLSNKAIDTTSPATFRDFDVQNNEYDPVKLKLVYKEDIDADDDKLYYSTTKSHNVFIPQDNLDDYNELLNTLETSSNTGIDTTTPTGRYFYKDRQADTLYKYKSESTTGIPLGSSDISSVVSGFNTAKSNYDDMISIMNETTVNSGLSSVIDDVPANFRVNVFEDTTKTVEEVVSKINSADTTSTTGDENSTYATDDTFIEINPNDLEDVLPQSSSEISNDIHIGFREGYSLCTDKSFDDKKTYFGSTDGETFNSLSVKDIDKSMFVLSEHTEAQAGVDYYTTSLPNTLYQYPSTSTNTTDVVKYKFPTPTYLVKSDWSKGATVSSSTVTFSKENYFKGTNNDWASAYVRKKYALCGTNESVDSNRTYYDASTDNRLVETAAPNFSTGKIYKTLKDSEITYVRVSSEIEDVFLYDHVDTYDKTNTSYTRQVRFYSKDNPCWKKVTLQDLKDASIANAKGELDANKYGGIVYTSISETYASDDSHRIDGPSFTFSENTDYYVIVDAAQSTEGVLIAATIKSDFKKVSTPEVASYTYTQLTADASLKEGTLYYKKYKKTTDKSIDTSKTYYTLSNNVYTAISNPTVHNISNYYEQIYTVDFYYSSDGKAYDYDYTPPKQNDSKLDRTISKYTDIDSINTETNLWYFDKSILNDGIAYGELNREHLVDNVGRRYFTLDSGKDVADYQKYLKQFTQTVTNARTCSDTEEVQLSDIPLASGDDYMFSIDTVLYKHINDSYSSESKLYYNDAVCYFIPEGYKPVKDAKTKKVTAYKLFVNAYLRYKINRVPDVKKTSVKKFYIYESSDGQTFDKKSVAKYYYIPDGGYTFSKDHKDFPKQHIDLGGFVKVPVNEKAEEGVTYYTTSAQNLDMNKPIDLSALKVHKCKAGDILYSASGSGTAPVFKLRSLADCYRKVRFGGGASTKDATLKRAIEDFKKRTISSTSTDKIWEKIRVPIRYYEVTLPDASKSDKISPVLSTSTSILGSMKNFKDVPKNYFYKKGNLRHYADYYTATRNEPSSSVATPSASGWYEKREAASPQEYNRYTSENNKYKSENKNSLLYDSESNLCCFAPLSAFNDLTGYTNDLIEKDSPTYRIKSFENGFKVSYPLCYTSFNVSSKQLLTDDSDGYSTYEDVSTLIYTLNDGKYKYNTEEFDASTPLVTLPGSNNILLQYDGEKTNYSNCTHTFTKTMQSLSEIVSILNEVYANSGYSTHIMYKPHWFYLGLYYKQRDDKVYYRPTHYVAKTYNQIGEWLCTAEAEDTIAENPKVKLNEIFSPMQDNTEVTFTKNQLWTLSQGDVITATTDSQYLTNTVFPVFSNDEIELDLESYDLSYQRVGNDFEDVDKVVIPGCGWRGYSNLQLNCSGSTGQSLEPNHTLKLYLSKYNDDTDYYQISNTGNTNRHFQLSHPVENKTGSFIDVSTYSQTKDEILNDLYSYDVLDSADNYTFTSDNNTYIYFKKLNDTSISSNIEIDDVKFSAGDYLFPINGLSDAKIKVSYKYTTEVTIDGWGKLIKGDKLKLYITYKKTSDETINDNKTYYTYTYTKVTTPTVHNISNYYEQNERTYSKTTDTEINSEKTYYIDTYTEVSNPTDGNISNYYERETTETDAEAKQISNAWYAVYKDSLNDSHQISLDDNEWALQKNEDNKFIVTREITTHLNPYLQEDKNYFLGNKTHFGHLHIPEDTDEMKIVSTSDKLNFNILSKDETPYSSQDDAIYILINDIYKFVDNDDLSSSVDEIKSKIQQLDVHSLYNYVHVPSDDDLITDPLLPKSYWNKNHPYNQFTIAQLDADKINIRFTT